MNANSINQLPLPYWIGSVPNEEYSTLTSDLKTDVVIVGGGMTGLSIAYSLVKEGKSCIVLEAGLIGGNETPSSSAHLTHALDSRYYKLEKVYGERITRLVAQSHTMAINRIERIIKRENIDCDFLWVDGFLILYPGDSLKSLQQEFEATRRAGLSTELVTSAPDIRLREKIAMKFPMQAQLHPVKYLHGLSKAIVNYGGKIFTNTTVTSIDENGANTDRFRISADHIVVTTSQPFDDRFTMLAKRLQYRSYIIAATVHKGLISPALWWDTGRQYNTADMSPYHYARIQPFDEEFDLLICGGQNHIAGEESKVDPEEESERFTQLESWLFDHFQLARDVVYRWSELVMEPVDLLGYIGRNSGSENIYVVAVDAGNGLTYGAIAGSLIPDLISGRENPWEQIYNPARFAAYIQDKPTRNKISFLTAHGVNNGTSRTNRFTP